MILGVDPGLTGGWALLADNGTVLGCDELPVIRDQGTAWIDSAALKQQILSAGTAMVAHHSNFNEPLKISAYVERIHAMPKNGSQAAFSQGMTLASILATLQLTGCAINLVTPQTWKRAAGLLGSRTGETDAQRKGRSLDKARLLYPTVRLDRKKDHGMAEALLIANYGLSFGHKAVA